MVPDRYTLEKMAIVHRQQLQREAEHEQMLGARPSHSPRPMRHMAARMGTFLIALGTRLRQQEQHTCVLQEEMQQFIQEISTLRSLAEEAGIEGHLFEVLDIFKHEVEQLDSSVWERKEVRVLNRNELVRLSLSVLRAVGSRSC